MITHTILEGDVIDGLRTLPDGCVQCTVTSPPYFALRDYGVDGQIGLEATPEEFIDTMVRVFREVRRVTRGDGVLWLNLGDSYCSNGVYIEKYKENHPEHSDLHTKNSERYQNRKGVRGGDYDLKAKDLMGIPWRVAFALQADGWYFRSAIPWIKRNCMPESTTDRPTSAIEYIFLMTKSAKYFYDGDAVRRPAQESTKDRGKYGWNGKMVFDANGNETRSQPDPVEKMGDRWCPPSRNYRNSDPFFESWQGLYSEGGEPLALIVNPQSRPELHFATFPDLLAETFIKAGTSEYGCCPKCGAPYQRIVEASGGKIGESWHPHSDDGVTGQVGFKDDGSYKREFRGWKPGCDCNSGEPVPCVVLDPFMGSGTVAVVSRDLNRSSVGCELNPEYVKIIKQRLQAGSCLDTGVVSYRFEKVPG